MDRLQAIFNQVPGMGGGMPGPPVDATVPDDSETVYISSLSLLKMLKHGNEQKNKHLDTLSF